MYIYVYIYIYIMRISYIIYILYIICTYTLPSVDEASDGIRRRHVDV